MEIDLHGYHPAEIAFNGVLGKILEQAWEMGESDLTLIHGHGRNRGLTPGFVNTNTGYFGLCIGRALRNDPSLCQWIKHTTLDCPTDRLHFNRTEKELTSDEKTIGLFLRCAIPLNREFWSRPLAGLRQQMEVWFHRK
jgi:hypothetical protein